MSEAMNEFPRDLFDFIESSDMNEYEDAMSDPRVRNSIPQALDLERRINMGRVDDVEAEIKLLDQEVDHVINQMCHLSGLATTYSPEGEAVEQIRVDDIYVQFNGYEIAPSIDSEDEDDESKYNVVFVFYAIKDEEGEFITRSVMNASLDAGVEKLENIQPCRISIMPNDAIIDFAITTPDRAMAWLNVLYPETIEEIDRLLLARVEDGHVVEPTDDQALLSLKEFELKRPEDISEQTWLDYKNAVAYYVANMLAVDSSTPYGMVVGGPGLIENDDKEDTKTYFVNRPPIWMDVHSLIFFDKSNFEINDDSSDKRDAAVFALRCREITSDLYDPQGLIIVPISSIDSLRSLRSIDATV